MLLNDVIADVTLTARRDFVASSGDARPVIESFVES